MNKRRGTHPLRIEEVERLMLAGGWHAEDLALKVGVSTQAISDWLNKRKNVYTRNLQKLAKVLGNVPVETLVEGYKPDSNLPSVESQPTEFQFGLRFSGKASPGQNGLQDLLRLARQLSQAIADSGIGVLTYQGQYAVVIGEYKYVHMYGADKDMK